MLLRVRELVVVVRDLIKQVDGGPRIGMYPPPFIGNWPNTSGRGQKKQLKIKSPIFKKTVPLSNFDLIRVMQVPQDTY